jgi:periplasmic protein TonB
MAKRATTTEPNLPWLDSREDRTFRWLSGVMLLLFIVAGLILNSIQLPEIEKKNLVDVSPRLAKLILEKQKVKPEPKPEAPLPEKEKQPEKKKAEPKPEKKKEKKKEVKKESAREVAEKSGLIALADELEDLRESFDLDDVSNLNQQTTGNQETELASVASTSSLLSASAGQSSGGIQTDTLNRDLKTSELAQRQTTSVESSIGDANGQLASADSRQKQQNGAQGGKSSKRTAEEFERVFQKNKGAIFSIYQRAVRQNPALAGKVVVKLTIAPNGKVTAVDIVSSELGDEALERKLALRIKRFKFSQADVAEIIVTYPIDFLPS